MLLLLPGLRRLHHKLPSMLLLLLLLLPGGLWLLLLLLLPSMLLLSLLSLLLPWLLLLLALLPLVSLPLLLLLLRWTVLPLLLLLLLRQVRAQPCTDIREVPVHLLSSPCLCQPHLVKLLTRRGQQLQHLPHNTTAHSDTAVTHQNPLCTSNLMLEMGSTICALVSPGACTGMGPAKFMRRHIGMF